ncbi:MAG: malto-oligosyltrehalose trehalohydrolase [Solirubrobacteraceae bacterium]
MSSAPDSGAYPWERTLGARIVDAQRAEFRVWAPRADTVAVAVGGAEHTMGDVGHGVFEAVVPAAAGDDYVFVLDSERLPDPCSRWQPEGLRGPSRLVADLPRGHVFRPPALHDLVLYELHIGTFSPEGTFDAAIPHLAELAELGVTAIEIMPVAEFPGVRGWGYDGVYISAAQSSYGGPDGLRRLVTAAHELGLAVILDVVYNHLGASGVTAIQAYGPYFTAKYETPWGKAINYDDAECDPVREWVLQSAEGWIRDFDIDGLRMDAIHAIFDSSPEHVVAAISRRIHAAKPGTLVIAESGLNDPKVMRTSDRGGWGADAAWADDFHHALRALVTDERDGYYADFGRVAQLAKAFKRPHVDDGGYSPFRRRRFGAPAGDIPPEGFVVFSQDHDQVGNRAFGERMPAAARPLAAFCTLLSPFTPMLFMGEEYGEPAPFQFFSSHIDEAIAIATREGRRREFAAFASFGHEVPDPEDPATFAASKLTREREPELEALYRSLLAMRSELSGHETQSASCDERGRWLRLRRGEYELTMNFGSEAVTLPSGATVVALGTDRAIELADGAITLPPMTGALTR